MKKIKTHLTFKVIIIAFFTLQTFSTIAQTYQNLYDFSGTNGSRPYAKLTSDGNYFYGTTNRGGVNNSGVIFKIKLDGTDFIKLHDFDGTNGERPYSSLTIVGSQLFGVTHQGGINGQGVLFKINTDGTNFTKLVDVVNNNGQNPESSLYFDGSDLYGTTYGGGLNAGGGMLYKVNTDGTNFTILHSFTGGGFGNGSQPQGELLSDGTYFYGSLYTGGAQNVGSIYRINMDGTGFQSLHNFDSINIPLNFCIGSMGLILDNGYLYGTTFSGGANGLGFVYKMETNGNNFTILHDFLSATGSKSNCELLLFNGYLYGTTTQGSPSGGGVIFRIKTDGTDFTSVYDFNTSSGYSPYCGLIYTNYSLYGVTTSGGSNGDNGTIFKFNDEFVTSVNSLENGNDLKLYPNPSTGILNVDVKQGMLISVADASGKKLFTRELKSGINQLDLTSLTSGVYFLQTQYGTSVRFVKQ